MISQASVGVGVPPQNMNVILDTGYVTHPLACTDACRSADLWIASSNCTSLRGCTSLPTLNITNSSTALDMNTTFSVKYGSGSASGEIFQDYVGFGGFNVSSQGFAVCDTVSPGLLSGNISGLMGTHSMLLFTLTDQRSRIPNSRSLRDHPLLAKPLPSRRPPRLPRLCLLPDPLCERHLCGCRRARWISHVRVSERIALCPPNQLRQDSPGDGELLAGPDGCCWGEWDERYGAGVTNGRDRHGVRLSLRNLED